MITKINKDKSLEKSMNKKENGDGERGKGEKTSSLLRLFLVFLVLFGMLGSDVFSIDKR